MRNAQRVLWAAVIGAILLLAGCQGDTKESPTQLDAPFQNAPFLTQTAQAGIKTNTPWPTPWPTEERAATSTPRATSSPFPSPTPNDGTPEVLDNIVTQGEWLYLPMTDEAGELRTLDEFLGRAVVVHTVSGLCSMCLEQEQYLLESVQDRHDYQLLGDTVVLVLNTVPTEPPSLVRAVFQEQLSLDAYGVAWPTAELLAGPDTPADYLIATASQELVDALARDLGQRTVDPTFGALFLIDQIGQVHFFSEGMVDNRELINGITAYADLGG